MVSWLKGGHARVLQDKPFAVFGLGNSCYTQFCGAAVLLDKLAHNAGGHRVIETYKVSSWGK